MKVLCNSDCPTNTCCEGGWILPLVPNFHRPSSRLDTMRRMAIVLAEILTDSVSTPRFALAAHQVIERWLREGKKQPTKWEGNLTLHKTLNWSMGWIWIDTYHHYESPTTKVSIHATPLLTTMDSSIADDSHQMHKCHTWIGNSSDIHRIGRNDQYNFAMFPRHVRWVWE